jgi:hypothetical protein
MDKISEQILKKYPRLAERRKHARGEMNRAEWRAYLPKAQEAEDLYPMLDAWEAEVKELEAEIDGILRAVAWEADPRLAPVSNALERHELDRRVCKRLGITQATWKSWSAASRFEERSWQRTLDVLPSADKNWYSV